MILYSQNDPAYRDVRLGKSKLTIGSHGCFLVALANLFQIHPLELLKIPGAVTPEGLVVSSVIAIACGGKALPPTKVAPKGWCIAVTDHYTSQGFPTHFFDCLVDIDKRLEVDPLDPKPQIESLIYKIVEYRPFEGVKLAQTLTWQQEAERWSKKNGIVVSGWETPEAPMSQVRVVQAMKNYHEAMMNGAIL